MKPGRNESHSQQPALRRTLSLPLVVFYGLGNIIGAGIYVLLGEVVAHAGIFAPLSFLLAALLAGLTAFSYAELAARHPLSAGEAVYVFEGLGLRSLSALVGVLIIMAGIVSAATILRGFAAYLQVLAPVPAALSIPAMTILLGALALWGILQSVTMAAILTLVEIGGLLMIIWSASPGLLEVQLSAATLRPLLETGTWFGVVAGGFLAFYAFIGFEDMVNLAEEVKHAEHNLPRAIIMALLLSTLLYLMVAVVAVASGPVHELAGQDAPLAWLYQSSTGRDPVVISLISLFAVINGALVQIIMATRVCYGMGRQRWLPALFARVSPRTRTPAIATVVISSLVLAMALWLPLAALAKSTSYFLLLVFCLVNLSLWRLQRRQPQQPGLYRAPHWVPVAGFLACAGFVVAQTALDLTAR